MRGTTLPDLLASAVRGARDDAALTHREGSLTYGELALWVERCAAVLAKSGIAPGERVALLALNTPAALVWTFAVAHVGAVLVPLNWRLSPRELATVTEHADIQLLLAEPELLGLAQEATSRPVLEIASDGSAPGGAEAQPAPLAVQVDEQDAAHLYYTSGTTGDPKGVVLTHRNVCTHALFAVAELSLTRADTWAHIAPMFHLADAWATLAITAVGGRHVFLERFEEGAALDLFESERVTLTNLVPAMLNLMVEHAGADASRFPDLRVVLSGGAPIAPRVVRRITERLGAPYLQTYGMTETSPYLTLSRLSGAQERLPEEQRFALSARTGRPFMGVALEVVNEAGQPVARDDVEVGEIRVSGPTVTPGYLDNPAATAAALRDGWLYTGDLATIDASGSVQIVDRKKDMILSGGECVYSTEVEAVLYEHPSVLEAAAYGEPDERWGERVCCAVRLRAGAELDARALIEFCRASLAGYKCPKEVRFVDQLPRTGSGKIAKRLLRGTGRA